MRYRRTALGHCRKHRRATVANHRMVDKTRRGSVTSMFLPKDLTTSERDLVASVTRELLVHRRPSTRAEEEAVRQEAAQVAAEMIQEARAQQKAVDPEDQELDRELANSAYHQRLARLREASLAIQEMEDRETDDSG